MSFKKNPDSQPNNSDGVSLFFKNHQEFFEEYYILRKKVNEGISSLLLDISVKKELLKALSSFINWSSDYILNIKEIREEYFELVHFSKDNDLKISKNLKDFYNKVVIIWDKINKDNKIYELIPKPNIEVTETDEGNFWGKEEHLGLKQIKKGFIDVLSIKKD